MSGNNGTKKEPAGAGSARAAAMGCFEGPRPEPRNTKKTSPKGALPSSEADRMSRGPF